MYLCTAAQTGAIHGVVRAEGKAVEYATVSIATQEMGVYTNLVGKFHLHDLPLGEHLLTVDFIGYEPVSQMVVLSAEQPEAELELNLGEPTLALDEVVVTGTKTFKRRTESPVIVNVMTAEALSGVQACNLSDGLKFQPGLRVETDCQTCNYTQLRINGLAGGYSQILINGRPIFSPLTGLYGLEQLPVNMIERIEVVRGGGSSLYGSSAIGGTVNVITKIPKKNGYSIDASHQRIGGQTGDLLLNGNTSFVTKEGNSGVSLFLSRRQRGLYDANGDNFSEVPELSNISLGANFFLLPDDRQKIELSISNLNEYRYGGEQVEGPAHLALQAEERDTRVWMASADYQINFSSDATLIAYAAAQRTDRTHYTGIFPETDEEIAEHLALPPYGESEVRTGNIGVQFNYRLGQFLGRENILTIGSEYLYDAVRDEIPTYRYLIDQTTGNFGTFLQSDWTLFPKLSLLSGVRLDAHNLVEGLVASPRAALLWKPDPFTQVRLNYGTGFRAPQAFDTDLHIAFAGGGISRVVLAEELLPERSRSYSASLNYDRPTEKFIAGFTLEAFRTVLDRAFFLQPIGEDSFGEQFEKRNGQGAVVQGGTLELRANFNRKIQVETGLTLQTSRYEEPVAYLPESEGIRDFVRTPNQYGFATLSLTPDQHFKGNLNYVYTGSMLVPHFAGAPNQTTDELSESPAFSELDARIGYTFPLPKLKNSLEFYAGVRNVFNQYQRDFDFGRNRDSNYVYGPGLPRSFYFGIRLEN